MSRCLPGCSGSRGLGSPHPSFLYQGSRTRAAISLLTTRGLPLMARDLTQAGLGSLTKLVQCFATFEERGRKDRVHLGKDSHKYCLPDSSAPSFPKWYSPPPPRSPSPLIYSPKTQVEDGNQKLEDPCVKTYVFKTYYTLFSFGRV